MIIIQYNVSCDRCSHKDAYEGTMLEAMKTMKKKRWITTEKGEHLCYKCKDAYEHTK